MKISFGVPEGRGDSSLGMRLAYLTLLRLVFLSVLLGVIGRWYLREVQWFAFSVRVALIALACAFALAGVYAASLRVGRNLHRLAYMQVVFDQITWTVLVYVSGGANSGATSLYGLTSLTAAILLGLPAAAVAAGVGYAAYMSVCLLMAANILPPPPDQPDVIYATTMAQVIYPLGLNLLVLVVVTLLGGYLAERLRLTGGKLAEATERAQRAERMAILGKVAAGLAHEIRNPLGSISASIELLRDAPNLTRDDRHLCDIVRTEALRLDDLVGDMLDLTRSRMPEPTSVDLAAAGREVVKLASRLGRSSQDVKVTFEGPSDNAAVMITADPKQIRQLIWNLVRNGVQATAPGTDVTVRVEQKQATVLLEVIDRGPGLSAEAREHLFDAFFSTRTHGVGIGLAVVKTVVDDHGWSIDVSSEDGAATSFRVSIPALGA